MNKLLPWFVAAALCGFLYMTANFAEPLFPLTHKWTFYIPFAMMCISAVAIVRGYFKINAIFDRMEKR